MLSIEINGIPLDLPEDFSATLNLKSPLFNTVGDFTFPFKLPATPKNMGLLEWKHRVESNRDKYDYISADLLFSGQLIFSGSIRIKKAADDTYQGSLFVERGNFNFEIKDKWLNDIDFGNMVFNTDQEAIDYLNSTLDHLYPLEPIACPEIYNADYFDPPTEDPEQKWYNLMSQNDGLLSLYTSENNRSLLVPNVYLQVVLNKMAEAYGYTLNDEFFNVDESLRQLAFYSSYSINFRFWFINNLYLNLLLPKVKIAKLITSLEGMFNCSFLVDTKHKVIGIVSKKSVLKNPDFIEFSNNITSISVESEKKKEGFVFSMETDAGDKVVEDALEQQKVTLDLIRGAVDTVDELQPMPLAELGDIYYIISDDVWYQLNVVNFLIDWRVFDMSGILRTKFIYKKNVEQNKIETGLSILVDKVYSTQCGNLSDDYRDIKTRLFFIRRVPLFGDPYTHTYAMNWADGHALTWSGRKGLFVNHWKDWIDWEMFDRKKISFKKMMNHAQIKDFDFTKKVMINGNRYLVSELQVIFKKNTIETAKLKAFSCP